jgi:hypothetical protein
MPVSVDVQLGEMITIANNKKLNKSVCFSFMTNGKLVRKLELVFMFPKSVSDLNRNINYMKKIISNLKNKKGTNSVTEFVP